MAKAHERRMNAQERPARGRTISEAIRDAALSLRLSPHALARLSGVDARVVARFLAGERDIRLETADRLADAMGLRLVPGARGRPRPPRDDPGGGPEIMHGA